MDTFDETSALSSRKYVSEQGMSIPDLSKKLRYFVLYSSVFALEKQPKNLRDPLVATFNKNFYAVDEYGRVFEALNFGCSIVKVILI